MLFLCSERGTIIIALMIVLPLQNVFQVLLSSLGVFLHKLSVELDRSSTDMRFMRVCRATTQGHDAQSLTATYTIVLPEDG